MDELCVWFCLVWFFIGAYFIQTVVEKFFGFYGKAQENLTESEEAAIGKQCSNLIIILSHLYNFQVISSQILTDCLKIFIENFSELDVELLLLVLKCIAARFPLSPFLSLRCSSLTFSFLAYFQTAAFK